VSWLASKRIVDKIVLITGDSDFVPAMKFARREGLMVYLVHFCHGIKAVLKEHCDGIVAVQIPSNSQCASNAAFSRKRIFQED